jgi:hypothetical protein
VEGKVPITCLFNPEQLKVGASNQWDDATNVTTAPNMTFSGRQAGTMSMELILDTTATGTPVTQHTTKLLDLMNASVRLDNDKRRPPWVIFHWGEMHSFKAVVKSLDITFTYFASNGDPLRARANLSFQQYEEEGNWGPQNPSSGTHHPHILHQVQPGETIDRIAAKHYQDPARWRIIAEANSIIDPLAISPGTRLIIPKRETNDDVR